MGSHDSYGKSVLRTVVGQDYSDEGPSTWINYGVGAGARIDGTVGSNIAVEVESRVSKQVRGAVLDLICHPYPRKLLVLLPVHMSNPEITGEQCRFILRKLGVREEDFRVVILKGTGDLPELDHDANTVRFAIQQLRERP